MIHFAATVLEQPLDPWQQWLVIHLGELLPDGRPRFRQALVIVARQNGKTHLCKVLALFWMYVEKWPMIFGTSTNLEQAKEAWEAAVELAEQVPVLASKIPKNGKRIGNGQQVLMTTDRSRYKIGAADRKGGRGKSIDRAIGDELREQHSWDAYNAAYNAMNARPRAQVIYITNMGDARSVVLNSLRADALEGGNDRLGVFEWSAPPGTHVTDPAGWAAANPQLGRRMDYDTIRGAAQRVAKPGADPVEVSGFQTEILCQAVDQLDPAIDPTAWAGPCLSPAPIDTATRGRLGAVLDVSLDGQHATLAVAVDQGEGVTRVEAVQSWDGPQALADVLADLPRLLAAIRPRQFGWFPGGPAAVIAAQLKDRSAKSGRRSWAPRGTVVAELTAEAPAVCMGLAQQVTAGSVRHSGQALLDTQVERAEKLWTGDRWVFTRRGRGGHVDAVYAAAGAVHLSRTMPAPRQVSRRGRVGPAG